MNTTTIVTLDDSEAPQTQRPRYSGDHPILRIGDLDIAFPLYPQARLGILDDLINCIMEMRADAIRAGAKPFLISDAEEAVGAALRTERDGAA